MSATCWKRVRACKIARCYYIFCLTLNPAPQHVWYIDPKYISIISTSPAAHIPWCWTCFPSVRALLLKINPASSILNTASRGTRGSSNRMKPMMSLWSFDHRMQLSHCWLLSHSQLLSSGTSSGISSTAVLASFVTGSLVYWPVRWINHASLNDKIPSMSCLTLQDRWCRLVLMYTAGLKFVEMKTRNLLLYSVLMQIN